MCPDIKYKQWVVAGVVSMGYKCGDSKYPGLYTSVNGYISWILREVNGRLIHMD